MLATVNLITSYIHDIVMENGGTILENSPPYFNFFWHSPDDLSIEHENTKYYSPSYPFKNLGKTV